MKPLRSLLDKLHPLFVHGGKLEKFYALYEMADTFLFTPGETTKGGTQVRDAMDLKRMMITVVIALQPVLIWTAYNTGYQANKVIADLALTTPEGWRAGLINYLGIGFNPNSIFACIVHGLLYFLPIFLVVQIVGGFWEGLFASVRGHEINEGFLVTGMLFPLILPPTMPLWQVALGISFGVVMGKEVFGGTGKNFLNPALAGRAFLFFAYPASISGDSVWVAVDGYSGATALSLAASKGMAGVEQTMTWMDAFIGRIPGSMGETSALACLIGAAILIATGVGSWRIMLSVLLGALVTSTVLYAIGSSTNPMFSLTPGWHIVLGGFAFGLVFMATDPVSAAMTEKGQWVYGALIGFMVILVRVINPAFPEGMMLAILFGNVCAPLIDYYVVKANILRRKARNV
ncbi:MAG: NADH:ubiquinone reductase (Na(+)-transporting) subunit B [Candidatus Lambdaproteobacteria bacterium RIFOXYD1_FULL_56_27]|uniref:Na(+)-translocating NADH-quinone reductase subunit B n=1 Tax=Candidatus Lambdaproteobacteria bacterium RIFOXYD2_FULL_56_26 TaxID=1817773 RepID=A0A1F6GMV3_9PROT|nr:MAG: NADH:ubiquinone reductase (Na(+)-transporting) subunit B [Candidatus Lambdaproteobacteria bacterium RIFOXYD2_FULL_56_26]OGH05553.1 MAG: NADH:ubiquinone reductase (Na(+)-transporting) subunit B [Candidatus Lambdaproteobacteria bacterium RIFOXYC1_FULL_56_13]OGH08512.1 MAG: NADH:ubiquinone reductase (Na(+)-transporting) subunit B [Candidatus Lambdaproteobacteria bacterium RIFOXYD1_FULL_56_27]